MKTTMKIEMLPPGDLVPYAKNPRISRTVEDYNAVRVVADSIRQFGFRQPIVVDADNVVVVGHTRLAAAKEIGLEKVPVTRAGDLTEEQVRAYRIADNKTNEWTGWDLTGLMQEVVGIENLIPGFTPKEMTILTGLKEVEDEERARAETARPGTAEKAEEESAENAASSLGLGPTETEFVQVSVFVKREHEAEAKKRCEEAVKDLR